MRKILIYENDFPKVHYVGVVGDYTLCGLESTGDEKLGLSPGVIDIRKRVNCRDCIAIVNHVKGKS